MKRILIDATSLSDQYKSRGIGITAKKIIFGIIKSNNFKWHVIGFDDIKNKFPQKVRFHSLGKIKSSTPLNLIKFRTQYLPIVKQVKPHIFFAPHLERGLPIGKCKTVVFLHDVIPFITGKYSRRNFIYNFIKGIFHKYNLKRAIQADAVVTNSIFSKHQIVKYLKISKKRVYANYLGLRKFPEINVFECDKTLSKYNFCKPYLLYWGGIEPNKNVDKLIQIYKKLDSKEDVFLAIIEKTLYRKNGKIVAETVQSQQLLKLIKELNIESRLILPGYVTDEELNCIIKNSLCVVHLSSYEGFGLAVTEAQSAGVPVIAADKSCYPEVLKDSALLIDPDNIEESTEKIREIIQDPILLQEYAQKGNENVKRFSWEKHSTRLIKIFKKIINEKS